MFSAFFVKNNVMTALYLQLRCFEVPWSLICLHFDEVENKSCKPNFVFLLSIRCKILSDHGPLQLKENFSSA